MKTMIVVAISVMSLIGLLYAWGLTLPENLKFQKSEILNHPIIRVWETVRDIKGQENWRSDINNIEVLDTTKAKEIWIEYPKSGPQIKFRTVSIQESIAWKMEIVETKGFSATWTGSFKSLNDSQTEIDFVESVSYPSPWMRIFAKIFIDLNSTMDLYLADLKTELERQNGK
ncbi:hypothetical protein [Leptospira sp. GIMC2001]|uniref:hypothetical protein n=1 Tax=Leptospira sp. GIMC2001 TaxID=1513297 RepID=UPI00234AFCDE|nr:hypothetical protein [Leptospira sp. GIMC2001]WCL47602.1 hypothetical protein O4O04_01145 [Leptospira sp. GIMC2001]